MSSRIGYSSLRTQVHADVAQLVEHHLAKVRVAGSNPVVRSRGPVCPCGGVAEWLRQGPAKPCTRVRFPSPPPCVPRTRSRRNTPLTLTGMPSRLGPSRAAQCRARRRPEEKAMADYDPRTANGIPTGPVGSLPRPSWLQRAYAQYDAGEITRDQLEAEQDKAVKGSIEHLEATGEPIISDG